MPFESQELGSREDPHEEAPGEVLSPRLQEVLRQIARDSITVGLEEGEPLAVQLEHYPGRLREPGAVFVTLERHGRLRGCIGSYTACRPLAEDVAENAFGAAFRDPRFPPLTSGDVDDLDLHISLLTPLEPLPVTSREDLLGKLIPGRDGLLLEVPPRRSTFLPQVWDSIPDPEAFLEQLLRKAGLPVDYWSPDLTFHRYRVVEF